MDICDMGVIYEGSVNGVTYSNPDGSSRQEALERMRRWLPVCQGKLQLGEYEGKPSLAVVWTVCAGSPLKAASRQLGFIPAAEVDGVLARAAEMAGPLPEGRSALDVATVLFVSIGRASGGALGTTIRVVVP